MLETVNLSSSLSKRRYNDLAPPLHERLHTLQYQCHTAQVPTVIVFEGWDAAGKGTIIARLLKRFDPRGFKVYPSRPPTADERSRPFLWRYWVRLPRDGEIALFDRSWYGRILDERVARSVARPVWSTTFEEIRQFERQLGDNGTAIVKFFLHISKEEQRRRLESLAADRYESWRVTKTDWRHHRQYDRYVLAIEEMMARTDASHAPWTIVEAMNWRFAEVKVCQTLVRVLEDALERAGSRYFAPSAPEDATASMREGPDGGTDDATGNGR